MRTSRLWLRQVVVPGASMALVLFAGQVPAQQTPGPGRSPSLQIPGMVDDEMSPRLLAGPKGEVLRLWQHRGDQKSTGGAVLLARATPGDAWQPVIEVKAGEKGVTIRDPALAISPAGNEMALVYRWWRDAPRSKQVRLARSDDGGKTWSQSATPIDTSGKAFDPNVAWAGGKTLVVVWSDERRGGRAFDIYSRRSPDGGVTWEPEQLLSRFAEVMPSDIFARPNLVDDGRGHLWVAWVGVKNGRSSIFLSRSADGGRTWTDPIALTGESQSVYAHSLHRAGDRMLLVWSDKRTGRDRLYAVASSDGGATWTSPARVDHLPASAMVDTTSPMALLGANGEALVTWYDARNGREDIFLSRSTDGGRTWGNEDRRMDMDEAGTAKSRYPQLGRAKDGRVALAWEDDRDGFESVYARVRPAGDGGDWGPEVRISTPAPKLASRLPQVMWGPDGRLFVAYEVWDNTLGPQSVSKRVETRIPRLDKP